ncbi:UDP-N-acetylglucosamine--N-acetylmuramyl-(pentapeptide) pyrophosphoryl-undecaprenol N-acetylglucosamine transferase [Candidatus Magnetomoraceae bacterium gMMP-1]
MKNLDENHEISTVNIIISGGATGGHLFPGIAIAQAFKEKNPENKILFLGTGRPIEKTVLPAAGFEHKTISAEGLKRTGLFTQIRALFKIPIGMYQAARIFWNFKPDLVLGVGGYSSGPVVIAARIMGIKTAIQEQNSVPGLTNRVLSHFANKIYVSFPYTKSFFSEKKVLFTGNPVRKELLSHLPRKKDKNSPFTVFIIGGSQGAHAINMAVIESLDYLAKSQEDGKQNIFIIHQTGTQDEDEVTDAYKKSKIPCLVRPFFHDMAEQYEKADLIICRAGATTVAELTALGKAAVFIPFPFAADNHQQINAEFMVHEGAAEMILQSDLNEKILAEKIMYYKSNKKILSKMQIQAGNLAKSDAAYMITEDCYRLLVA